MAEGAGTIAPGATERGDAADRQLAAAIAAQLGEMLGGPIGQIRRVLQRLGAERAWALLAEALAIEARGGMVLPDGSRRRTAEGIFFHLVREQTTGQERQAIFALLGRGSHRQPRSPAVVPAFDLAGLSIPEPRTDLYHRTPNTRTCCCKQTRWSTRGCASARPRRRMPAAVWFPPIVPHGGPLAAPGAPGPGRACRRQTGSHAAPTRRGDVPP